MVTTELFDGQGPETESVQTIEFTDQGGITLMVQTNRYPTGKLCDDNLAGQMDGGMEATYALLDELLATQQA